MQTAEIHQFPVKEQKAPKGPQLEDGYTRIANELFDDIIGAPVTDRERRVVLAIVRLTYGWNKKSDRVYAEDVAKLTSMHDSRVSKVMSELVRRNVIFRQGGSRSPVTLNKDVSSWEASTGSKRQAPTKRAESAQIEPVESAQIEPTYKDRKDNPPLTTFEGGASAAPKKPSPKQLEYTQEFELAWAAFPKRSGANPKRDAFKCWRARLAEGTPPADMVAGVERYAAFIRAKGDERSEFVMQAKRFFGTNAEFENDWIAPAPRAHGYGAQGGQHANRPGYDQKRAEQDRIAARLADPHDSGWMEGLFDEEDAAGSTGESGVYATGSDLSPDMADSVQHGSDADAGQAGSGYIDGEVVDAADDAGRGHGGGANQGRGRRVATERGESGEVFEAETGGLWNA